MLPIRRCVLLPLLITSLLILSLNSIIPLGAEITRSKESHFVIEEPYDQTQRAITDSMIWNFSTYLGGSGEDFGRDVAVDSSGNIIIVGGIGSANFPLLNAYQSAYGGGESDVFIAKFSSDGQSLLFFTFLGGDGTEWGVDVEVDSANNIWITGLTSSSDFPIVNAYQTVHSGGEDVFIAKFSSDGQSLLFSSYLGGSSDDRGWRLAIDSSDNMIVAGYSRSNDFPTVNATQETFGGAVDFILFKFSSDGQSLLFSTYHGGSNSDWAHGIALDAEENIIVIGTLSVVSSGDLQAHIAKFSSEGQLLFSKSFGGISSDYGHGVAVDSVGNIIVTGTTASASFPTVNASQEEFGGREDTFVTKLTPDGNYLFSTYLGGSGTDGGYFVTIDSVDNIFITGNTVSSNFPILNAIQETNSGDVDAYITYLDPNGQLLFSTYIGGRDFDGGGTIAFDATGVILVGDTTSNDFPLVNAYQDCPGGNHDLFLCKFVFSTGSPITPSTCTQPFTSSFPSTSISSSSTGTSNVSSTSGFVFLVVVTGLISIVGIFPFRRKKCPK
ncbi:MAG: SBBP repeat-containing protein [Candidatus Hodarchaeota archaeon]